MNHYQCKFTVLDKGGNSYHRDYFGEAESPEEFTEQARVAIRKDWHLPMYPILDIHPPVELPPLTEEEEAEQQMEAAVRWVTESLPDRARRTAFPVKEKSDATQSVP